MEGLRRIAAEAGESMAHLALSWALQRPSVTSVLIGARNATHVDQAFRALESPPCREIMERVETLAAVSDDSQRADNPNPSR
jgi:aryl-alcohol dehydrogenase-like predicted oxidoreductase